MLKKIKYQRYPPKMEEAVANGINVMTMAETNEPKPENEIPENPTPNKVRRPILRVVLLGLLAVLVLGALGGLGGYMTALKDRQANESRIVSTEVTDQFLLGLVALEHEQYEVARQHFEYILKLQPNNTAAAEKLTEALLMLNEVDALPTPVPTATPSPTPDTRSQDELYATAMTYLDQQDWSGLLDTLDALRTKSPDYKPVELDGLYYLAYRNRGIHRIQVEGNLEGGIFDLNRAEKFGYLDADAANYRTWAARYITGVSYWEIDWQEVINYLSPLVISAPYLADSDYFTAQDRLATAQVELNLEALSKARIRYNQKDWCEAYDLFGQAAAYIQLSTSDLSKFEESKNNCLGISPTSAVEETATPEPTETPTP